MKRIIIFLFFTYNFTLSFAQLSPGNKKWGTIKVKKISSHQVLPKLLAKKKPGIRVFWVRCNGSDFKETFPASYQSQLFPLVFNGRGLILTDENKQWSSNTVMGYNYEVFIGNVADVKVNSSTVWDMNNRISELPLGQHMWISKLYYTDIKGQLHSNEIGEFKIEKVR